MDKCSGCKIISIDFQTVNNVVWARRDGGNNVLFAFNNSIQNEF